MTVLVEHGRKEYTSAAGQTIFPYDFKIFFDTDLLIYVNEMLQTISTNYTVSGAGEPAGGNVTFVFGLEVDDSVVIQRSAKLLQSTDFIHGEAFPEDTVEDRIDLAIIAAQDVKTAVERSVKVGIASPYSAPTMPDPVAASVLGWNASNELVNFAEGIDGLDVLAELGSQDAGKGSALVAHNQINIYRPEEYGTVDPTGVADSSSAFSAMFDAMESWGGGIVYLQPGTFLLSSWSAKSVTVPFEIWGPGQTLCYIKGAGTNGFLKPVNNVFVHGLGFYTWDNIFDLDDIFPGLSPSLLFDDVNLAAKSVITWDSVNSGAKTFGIHIHRCRFYHEAGTGLQHPIELQGQLGYHGFHMSECRFTAYKNRCVVIGDGSSATSTWTPITVRDNVFVTGTEGATDAGEIVVPLWIEGQDITIENNSVQSGIAATGSSIDAAFAYVRGTNITIDNNKVDAITASSGAPIFARVKVEGGVVRVRNNTVERASVLDYFIELYTNTTDTADSLFVSNNVASVVLYPLDEDGVGETTFNDITWVDNDIHIYNGSNTKVILNGGTDVVCKRLVLRDWHKYYDAAGADDFLTPYNITVHNAELDVRWDVTWAADASPSATTAMSVKFAPYMVGQIDVVALAKKLVPDTVANIYHIEGAFETTLATTSQKGSTVSHISEEDDATLVLAFAAAGSTVAVRVTPSATEDTAWSIRLKASLFTSVDSD